MTAQKILFIGGGNMASAILTGLIKRGIRSENILVADRNQDKREALEKAYQIKTANQWHALIMEADVIFLAIKPQGAQGLCHELKDALKGRKPLLISVMAGISLDHLNLWLGEHLAIVRAMPNTPACIQLGATGLFANEQTSQEQKELAESLMAAVGITAWLKQERDINTITALSGSGPAYYFYFMESMQNAAVEMGIEPEVARQFAIQTAYGAAKLALDSHEDLATLRSQVTSKKGTTEAALNVMMQEGLGELLKKAMQAAQKRAEELSRVD